MSGSSVGATSPSFPSAVERFRAAALEITKRDGVRRVRRQRVAVGIDLLFGVAVVGGDRQDPAGLEHGSLEPAERDVERLDGRDRRVPHAGVTDHVGVGIVHHDDVVAVVRDVFDRGRGDVAADISGARSYVATLRLDGIEDAVFAGEHVFAAAVEEVRDVRVLLGLGQPQLASPAAATISPNTSNCGRGPNRTGFGKFSS
jgi:hypothetical protein